VIFQILEHPGDVFCLVVLARASWVSNVFTGVVELHVDGIESGAIYAVDIHALVFVDAGLFELEGPFAVENVV